MYILYGGYFTRSLIAEMVLAEGGIPYTLREIDIVNQEHRSAEFLAINPTGLVPALITPEGDSLFETPAINLYLADHHQLTDLAPPVGDPDRGRFLSNLFYVTDELEPVMKRYFYPHRYVLRASDAPKMKQQSLNAALTLLSTFEQQMSDAGPYILGKRFSLVDLTLCYWATYINAEGVLQSHPAIRKNMNLVINRPRIRAKFEALEIMRIEYTAMQSEGGGVK